MINENIKYSLRNLKKNKLRSFLTIFSIFIGITTIFIFMSFGLGLYEYINTLVQTSGANKLLIQSKGSFVPGIGSSFKLTDKDLEEIKKINGVYRVSGIYLKPVKVKQDSTIKYTFLIGYDPSDNLMNEMFNVKLFKGRDLRVNDKKKVILGYSYSKQNILFKKEYGLGDRINIDGIDMQVIGFFEEIGSPQDDSQIYLNLIYFKEIYPEIDYYSMIIADVDEKNLDFIKENIEERLRKLKNQKKGEEDFTVQSFEELLNTYSSVLNIIIGFIILIACISLVVSSVNTTNTMVTSVLERYKEIGVLKAVGAKDLDIFRIFLFESSFIGFLAGCIGIFFGFIFTKVAYIIISNLGYSFLKPSYNPLLFIFCIFFATITGTIAGTFPSYRASKLNVAETLRSE